MIKGLEALHHPRIKTANVDISAEGKHDIAYMLFDYTKQYAIIEKELKALDIIKTKKVNVMIFLGCDNLEEYNKHPLTWNYLTQEEYELLKEALL